MKKKKIKQEISNKYFEMINEPFNSIGDGGWVANREDFLGWLFDNYEIYERNSKEKRKKKK